MGKTIAEKIKAITKKKGYKVQDLASKLGISRMGYYKKVNRQAWSEEELRIFGDLLGCDIEITFIDRETGERI